MIQGIADDIRASGTVREPGSLSQQLERGLI